jgi:hypothetical protein
MHVGREDIHVMVESKERSGRDQSPAIALNSEGDDRENVLTANTRSSVVFLPINALNMIRRAHWELVIRRHYTMPILLLTYQNSECHISSPPIVARFGSLLI